MRINLESRRFGRLVVTSYAGVVGHGDRARGQWNCLCDCGKTTVVKTGALTSGNTRSCGCGRLHLVHGSARSDGPRTPEYEAWASMIKRCQTSSSQQFKNYGARGIKVCDRWLDAKNFLDDMGPRPSPKHSLDRIDVNGPYEPENCRWATIEVQTRNRRNNRFFAIGDVSLVLSDWAKRAGVPLPRITSRLRRGWDLEAALRLPPAPRIDNLPKKATRP